MKKNILIFLILNCLSLNMLLGQQSNTYRYQVNNIFEKVHSTPVTTGLLADYGIEFINIKKYNGVLSDTNKVDLGALRTLYVSLYSMRYNDKCTLPSPKQLNNTIDSYLSSNAELVPFVGMHIDYQKFKPDATSRGLSIINSRLYAGETAAIYDRKSIFAVALAKVRLEGRDHQFIFPASLFQINTGKTIAQVQADFGNGEGYKEIALNTATSVHYAEGGRKTYRLKIRYTDNSTVYSHGDFFVTIPKEVALARYQTNTLEVNLTAERVHEGQPASGLITVGYSGDDRVLDRPLIVAEGFDAENAYGYANFVGENDNGGIEIEVIIGGRFLRDVLETEGYDIVFMNYDNGTDYIQNNAFLLQRVIDWVNENKVGNEPNVVLGLSMGGSVARYALRDMEVNGRDHDTRLYISHDAPHQGANVPLGFQAMVRQLAGYSIGLGGPNLYYNLELSELSPEIGEGLALLDQPATRQLLRYQLSGFGTSITVDNSMHDAFMTEYRNLGYPQQTRNIAIASGSECAIPQAIATYGEFLNINESADFRYWTSLVTSILGISTSSPLLSIGGALTTSSKLKVNFNVRALPDQASKQIYHGKLQVRKKVAFLIPVNVTLFDRSFSSTSAMLPIDSSPGGIFDIADFGGAPDDLGLSETVFKNNVSLAFEQTAFSFVPTYSSLDIGEGAQAIVTSDLARVYSPAAPPFGSKHTPFDNFFTNENSNENHIQFTLNNGNWLLEELRGQAGYYSCAGSCSVTPQIIMTGPPAICDANSTFTLKNPPTGAPVTWTSSSNTSYVSGQGTGSYTVKAASATTRGEGWVRATIPTACGNISRQYNFWIGSPEQAHVADVYVQGFYGKNPVTLSAEGLYTLQVENVRGATSYNWVLPAGFSFLKGYGRNSTVVKVWTPKAGGTYKIRCYPQGACGSAGTGYTSLTIYIPGSSGGGGIGDPGCPVPPCAIPETARVYPNPSNGYLVINTGKEQTGIYDIHITDKMGVTRLELRDHNISQALDIRRLTTGLYIVHIRNREEYYTRHLQIR